MKAEHEGRDQLAQESHFTWRKSKGLIFALMAGLSLFVGLVVVLALLVSTVFNGSRLVAMHATAEAGLALSMRNLAADVGAGAEYFPYVTIAKVFPGSRAEALNLDQGDALLEVFGEVVNQVEDVWVALERSSNDQMRISWVPKVAKLIGELEGQPVPGQTGVFNIIVSSISPGSVAESAGLQPGDVLLASDGIPITGSKQAWETMVIATQRSGKPITLTIERAGVIQQINFSALLEGNLPITRNLVNAFWDFVTQLNEPRYPEHAGLLTAVTGSLYVILVMGLIAFPLGIGAAIYLEEYARRSLLSEIIEILIANLAGVPSVIYGLIGLEILARALNLGRSVLAGGITLALLVLPMMIIAAREALRAVPPSMREAAFSIGATRWQVIRHHVLPYSLPGIFTGMILSLSRAIGESAPLILLGAFLYVTFTPKDLFSNFTVIPLQIFDWATKPQDGFNEIAAAAILVLLAILLLLNATAIYLRDHFQKRW